MNDKEGNRTEITRESILEKEVLRLKTNAKKQSSKYYKLKKWSIFQFFFFVILLVMMLIYGVIQWPPKSSIVSQGMLMGSSDTVFIRDTIEIKLPYIDLEKKKQQEALIFEVPEDGIIYSIQMGAYTEIDLSPFRLNLLSIYQYSYENINQLTAGLFQDYNNAAHFLDLIIQMGFEDAFIVATKNGRRISVQEALSFQKQTLPENMY